MNWMVQTHLFRELNEGVMMPVKILQFDLFMLTKNDASRLMVLHIRNHPHQKELIIPMCTKAKKVSWREMVILKMKIRWLALCQRRRDWRMTRARQTEDPMRTL